VLVVACLAMALAALHRVAFSVLAVPIQAEFGLSLPEMGMLQSALLGGYMLGQVNWHLGAALAVSATPGCQLMETTDGWMLRRCHSASPMHATALPGQHARAVRTVQCPHPPVPLQIPSGILADRIGGAHLAASGLFLWSVVCLLFRCAESGMLPHKGSLPQLMCLEP
jgi:hypothetical protein